MQLYEVSELGYHTPLSGAEIARLFRARRLHRDSKCKPLSGQRWRTVDELFPLLKYDSSGCVVDDPADAPNDSALTSRHVIVAVVVTLLLATALFALLSQYHRSPNSVGRRQTPVAVVPAPRATPPAITLPPTVRPPAPRPLPRVQPPRTSTPPAVQAPRSPLVHPEANRRLIEEQQRREREQQAQAIIAERLRAKNEREAAQKQRDAYADTILPLDEYGSVDVGGSWVTVKIHDNDVTSFDAWVNGAFYDDLRKNKGTNGSRTDETPIYRNGKATLYYVWELSGKLNHCRLRVREE